MSRRSLTDIRDTGQPVLDDLPFLRAFLDVVIPPDDASLPGAGSLSLAPQFADSVRGDSTLGPLVVAGLQAVAEAALGRDPAGFAAMPPAAQIEAVESQLAGHPMLMTAVSLHVYRLYYQHPVVLEALGEPPRAPFPEGYALEPTAPDLLERLRLIARQPAGLDALQD